MSMPEPGQAPAMRAEDVPDVLIDLAAEAAWRNEQVTGTRRVLRRVLAAVLPTHRAQVEREVRAKVAEEQAAWLPERLRSQIAQAKVHIHLGPPPTPSPGINQSMIAEAYQLGLRRGRGGA